MGIRDTLHFDDEAYATKVSSQSCNRVLRKKHHAKLRTEASHIVAVLVHLISAIASGGLSLSTGTSCLAAAYAGRQAYVNRMQRKIIEAELIKRSGEKSVPRIRKRDIMAGVGLGIAAAAVDYVLPGLVELAWEGIHFILEHIGNIDAFFELINLSIDGLNLDVDVPEWVKDAFGAMVVTPVKEGVNGVMEHCVKKKTNKGF